MLSTVTRISKYTWLIFYLFFKLFSFLYFDFEALLEICSGWHQWRTQEFFSGGGFNNKFSSGQRAERAGSGGGSP
jgi:hypothetical protein